MTTKMKLDIAKVLGDDVKYVDENTRIAAEFLPENAWPVLIDALDHVNPGAELPGIDCSIAVTHETLEDFDNSRSNHWREPGRRTPLTLDGRRAILFEDFQLHKGGQRFSQIVVDFGDIRASLY